MRTLWKTKFMRAHWKLLVSVFLILFVKCLHLVTNLNSPIFLLQINGRYSPQLTSLQAPLTVSISTQAFGARKIQWEERINQEKPQWGIKENNGLGNATPNNHKIFFSNLLFGEKETWAQALLSEARHFTLTTLSSPKIENTWSLWRARNRPRLETALFWSAWCCETCTNVNLAGVNTFLFNFS